MLKIGTVFSGGLAAPEQALKQLGIEHENVFACEFDKFARQNYLANHKIDEDHFHIDINDMYGGKYLNKVDIVIGGSPCQSFSLSGLRKGIDDKRGKLIWKYFRIIDEVKPKIFVYENVKGMVSDQGGRTLKDFLEVFRSIGYYCHSAVLNTKDYGVPQNRERIYIVGFLDHDEYMKFQFAPKRPLEKRLIDVLEDDVDEKYYLNKPFSEYNQSSQGNKLCEDQHFHALTAGCHGYSMGYVKVVGMLDIKGKDQIRRVYDKYGISPSLKTMQGGYKEPKIQVKSATKSGFEVAMPGDSINLKYQNSKTRSGRVGKQIAQTIETQNSQVVVEPKIVKHSRIRKLTIRECFRLQGCNDTFQIAVSNSQAYKIAGNAMSVNILEMIFTQILNPKKQNNLLDFMMETT